MNRASKAAVKDKKTDYEKMLSIANPKHGPQFLAEVLLFNPSHSLNIPFSDFDVNYFSYDGVLEAILISATLCSSIHDHLSQA